MLQDLCSKTADDVNWAVSNERERAMLYFGTAGKDATRYAVLSRWGRIRRVLGLLELSSPTRQMCGMMYTRSEKNRSEGNKKMKQG